VLIDGDWLRTSWPSRNIQQVTNIASAQRRVNKYFVDKTPAELRNYFDIQSQRADDRAHSYHLTMVPKRKQIQEGITRLDLWVDEESLLLTAMRMNFPNGDTKQMVFADVVLNPEIDPAVFAIPR